MRKISPPVLPIPPATASIRTRIKGLSKGDVTVLETVGEHLGKLAGLDLAERIRLGDAHNKHDWADRKRRLTPECSSRWAGSITKASNEAYALARRNQRRTLGDIRRAIRVIEKKAHKPTRDVLGVERRKAGYADRGERHHKLRRAQKLRARHIRIASEIESGTVHIVRGGKKLLKSRVHLEEAGLTKEEWRERWEAGRTFFSADGESGKPLGNESIRVYPSGIVEVRLPSPLKHLANMRGCRYRLDGTAKFSYRAEEWLARVSADRAVAYRVWYAPEKGRWYVDAAFTLPAELTPVVPDYEDAVKDGAIGVDLNAGHLNLWRLDACGNPVGTPKYVPLDMDGHSTSTRDGHLRAAISETLRYARECGVQAIVVEDLGFDDARAIGRETMGRGQRGKRFRRDVAGIPTAKFKGRLVAMSSRMGIAVVAVDPAYTSKWGGEHWQKPLSTKTRNVSRHEAAAIVIGRRGLCLRARRRGVPFKGLGKPAPDRGHSQKVSGIEEGEGSDALSGAENHQPRLADSAGCQVAHHEPRGVTAGARLTLPERGLRAGIVRPEAASGSEADGLAGRARPLGSPDVYRRR